MRAEAEVQTAVRRARPACLRGLEGVSMAPTRTFGRLASRSPAMCDVFDALERFARKDVTVTLLGDTGAGKEVLAKTLHRESTRADGPFVVFDCGAVASNLVESELLGHERGAFTGAIASHPGAFERAHGGTLFLDELGELPLDLQPRLLRALESRCVRRVGGRQEKAVDVRVVAATNRDLRAEVAAGRFREDLLFRLAVAVVRVPPLRARLDDLPELVSGLLADLGRPDLVVAEETFDVLRAHSWPGNVRELKNTLSCALALTEPSENTLLPSHLRRMNEMDSKRGLDGLPLAGIALAELERAAIRQTMARVNGNKAIAARSLGIAVSTLYEKIRKYGL